MRNRILLRITQTLVSGIVIILIQTLLHYLKTFHPFYLLFLNGVLALLHLILLLHLNLKHKHET